MAVSLADKTKVLDAVARQGRGGSGTAASPESEAAGEGATGHDRPLTVIQQYSYHDPMKATIDIPDDLYRQVKAEAALRGVTVREVTTQLYRRWLSEGESGETRQASSEWLRSWLEAADEAMSRAPAGRSAREELEADRNRLEPQ